MKNKRKLKGMTLIEVLVALAVFAMLALVLLTYGVYVDSTRRATTNLKDKIVVEDHYAASKQKKYGIDNTDPANPVDKQLSGTDIEITIKAEGSGSYYELKDKTKPELGLSDTKKTYSNPQKELTGKYYSTKDVYTDGMTAEEITEMENKANGRLDLKFIDEIQEPTTAPTT